MSNNSNQPTPNSGPQQQATSASDALPPITVASPRHTAPIIGLRGDGHEGAAAAPSAHIMGSLEDNNADDAINGLPSANSFLKHPPKDEVELLKDGLVDERGNRSSSRSSSSRPSSSCSESRTPHGMEAMTASSGGGGKKRANNAKVHGSKSGGDSSNGGVAVDSPFNTKSSGNGGQRRRKQRSPSVSFH